MSEKCEIDTHEMCCNRNLQNLIEKKTMGMNEWMVGWLAGLCAPPISRTVFQLRPH